MREARIDRFRRLQEDRKRRPLDGPLRQVQKAWDATNPNDVDGKPLNEYARYQRISALLSMAQGWSAQRGRKSKNG